MKVPEPGAGPKHGKRKPTPPRWKAQGGSPGVQRRTAKQSGGYDRRVFLFELLCFSGEYDRAEKQLDILADGGPNSEMGALLYRSALYAARVREDLFQSKQYPKPPGELSGEGRSRTLPAP